MVSQEEPAVFILYLGLTWVWRRRRQHYRVARERGSEETISGVLSVSNAKIGYNYPTGNTAYTAWQCMADTFLDRIVAGWDEAE